MNAHIALVSVIAVGTYFGIVSDVLAQKEEPRKITKPLVAISGTNSHIRKPSYKRVTTAEDLRRTWASHLGTKVDDYYRAIMEVDFDRCLVVVIFRGEQNQVRQLTIDSVSEAADSITIGFFEHHYGIEIRQGDLFAERPPERPYAFIILPKSNKEVVLEEKIWSKEDQVFDRPPKWKEVARLKPNQTLSTKL